MSDSVVPKMPARKLQAVIVVLALTGSIACAAGELAHIREEPHFKQTPGGTALIPAGVFTMGSDKIEDDTKWRGANALNPYGFNDKLYVDEHPAHLVFLPAFLIDKYEVSNAQYRKFTFATKHRPPVAWQQMATT